MEDLAAKKCPPCDSAMGRLEGDRLRELSEQLGAGWKVVDDHHIEKTYSFKDFQEALSEDELRTGLKWFLEEYTKSAL